MFYNFDLIVGWVYPLDRTLEKTTINQIFNKSKIDSCYSRLILNILFKEWFPLYEVFSPKTATPKELVSPTSQEWQVVQKWHVSPEPITREQFGKERRPTCSTTSLLLLIRQFHKLKMHIKPPTLKDMLGCKSITSPPKKKFITTFMSHVIDLEEDEEWTCWDRMEGGGGEKVQTTIIHGNLEE